MTLSSKEERFVRDYQQLSTPSEAQRTTMSSIARKLESTMSGGGGATAQAQAPVQAQAQATPQMSSSNPAYYDPTNIMARQTGAGNAQMEAIERLLGNMAGSQMESQGAMLGQARDAQILELQKSLEDAVAEGTISIREAEKQFEANKSIIEKQAYNDSERTNLVASDRGISNSAQMVGLMQGDNARKNGLINENMTTRDSRVNDIKDRLNSIKNKTSLDIANANTNYNYGMANAQAQADMAKQQGMLNLNMQDYAMNREQQFSLDQAGLAQKYGMENMAQQNKYTLGQMGAQHNYDLSKMSKQQVYTLEQMAKQNGYTLSQMSAQQVNDLAKMAQGFGYDMSLQTNSQNFQSGENAMERSFKLQQFQAEQQAQADNYYLELEREMASYDPNTPEGMLRKAQIDSSYKAVQLESQAKLMADVMGKAFADHVGNPPKNPGKGASKKQVDSYNKQVDAYNSKLNGFMADPTNMNTFMSNLEKAEYDGKSSGSKPSEKTNWLDTLLRSMSNPAGGGSGISNGGDWFDPTP